MNKQDKEIRWVMNNVFYEVKIPFGVWKKVLDETNKSEHNYGVAALSIGIFVGAVISFITHTLLSLAPLWLDK